MAWETLSALTTVSLELDDYDNVHRWANAIIGDRYDQNRFMYEMLYGEKDSVLHAVKANYTAYYSKAVVYQKTGKFRAAIESFKDALVCDENCEASYYQLETLKRQEGAKELDRRAKQEQVKKQQEKKDRKKAAKANRKRAKKARGPGYVVGVKSS